MRDSYEMILWAKANENKLGIQTRQVFDILTILNEVPYLKPKYLTAYKKGDIEEFKLTVENVEKLIIKEKDRKYPELGSRISFFTSLEDEEAVSISIQIGVSENKFNNTIVIDLNYDYKNEKIEMFDELSNIFKKLVGIFNPYYGCITSESVIDVFDLYYDDLRNSPTSIFDINYWGEDLISKLAINRIKNKVFECVKLNKGYYIRLQKEPLDILNTEHVFGGCTSTVVHLLL